MQPPDRIAAFVAVAAVAAAVAPAAFATGAEDLWAALRGGGHVALMRHAPAPGTGDPAGFRLGDCSTQRNLDAAGREHARRAGEVFRANGVSGVVALSSQWCRCLETAELMALGPVAPFPPLNSFFRRPDEAAGRLAGINAYIDTLDGNGPTVLMVTHFVNIGGLTGHYPSSGELVVLRPNPDAPGFATLGTLTPGMADQITPPAAGRNTR